MKDLFVIESARWERLERSGSAPRREIFETFCYSRPRRLSLLLSVGLFLLAGIAQARGSGARLVVTANVACSVSAQFDNDHQPTVIVANCADTPGQNFITITNPHSGLQLSIPKSRLALSITVEMRPMSVLDKSGKVQQQMVKTTTVVPQ